MVERRGEAALLVVMLLCLLAHDGVARRPPRRRTGDKTMRVVEGVPAKELQYPFLVNVKVANKTSNSSCGGVILDSNYVLTPAHCVKGFDVLEVIAGVVDLAVNKNRVSRKVQKVELYPRQSKEHITNDLALLEVNPPLPVYLEAIQPIKLRRYSSRSGHNCILVGWSSPKNGTSHVEVHEAPLWPEHICRNLHPGLNIDTLCSGNAVNGADNCVADPGTALVCKGLLVGMVSIDLSCRNPGTPQSFTDISYYLNWVGRGTMHNDDDGSGDDDAED